MRKGYIILIIIFGILAWGNVSQAGFGISPPYVKSKRPLSPGSHFEQRITLLRSSSDSSMDAEITVNAPEIQDWITIDKGSVFDLPAGALRVPMIVKIDVPEDAEIGNYKGNINVKVLPKNRAQNPGVAIALGARIDINFDVTNEEFFEFSVKKINIPEFGTLKRPWSWKIFSYFVYRIEAVLKIENSGNVPAGPSKVHIDIYDVADKKLLESHNDTSIDKIDSFSMGEIKAIFPTNLKEGQYWARMTVYSGKDIIHKDKMVFTINSNGELEGIKHWLLLFGYLVVLGIVLLSFIKVKIWEYIFKLLYILLWPLRSIMSLLGKGKKSFAKKFWQVMREKADKHQSRTGDYKDPNEEE